MELTPDQQRAARACGFSFFSATQAQVQRLAMQKRIFRLDGQPFMATRDGAYWETHGTLMRAIEECASYEAQPAIAEAERSPQPTETPVSDAVLPPAREVEPAELGVTSPHETFHTPTRTVRRRTDVRTTVRRDVAGVAVETPGAAAANDAEASVSEPAAVAPEHQDDAVQESQGAVRRSRIRQPKVPRWVTAGKERRGRLKLK